MMIRPIQTTKSDYRGTVHLLANGPSAKRFNFKHRPVCGINRAYLLGPVDFTVAVDQDTFADHRLWTWSPWVITPKRFKPPPDAPCVWTPLDVTWRNTWSWQDDLTQPVHVGFSLYLAAQVCVWLGYKRLVISGWDLELGTHAIDGRGFSREARDRQLQGMGYMARALEGKAEVVVVGENPTRVFRKIPAVEFL